MSPSTPPALTLSQHQGLEKDPESTLHVRWPKYWSFSRSISLSKEYSWLNSFRSDWFDLLQSKGLSRVFSNTKFESVNSLGLSLLYGPTLISICDYWTIALTTQTFVDKVVSLLLNAVSRFAIAFLPRSKHLLISWLQSQSSVILEPKKIKSVSVSTFSPCICHEVKGPDAMIFVF